jgi:hypothetical protein
MPVGNPAKANLGQSDTGFQLSQWHGDNDIASWTGPRGFKPAMPLDTVADPGQTEVAL